MQGRTEGNPDRYLRHWFIYTLHDPRAPDVVRYVGWTTDPKRRLKTHIRDARTGKDNTRCGDWKRLLLSAGILPVMTVIETGLGGGHDAAEMRWVKHYRALIGDKLTNLTDGGEGTHGHRVPPEVRERISAANRGRKHTLTARRNMSAAHSGKKQPLEQTAKIAAANRGRKMPEAELARRRGRKMPPEAVTKSAAARKGQKRPPAFAAKMHAALQGRTLTPEHRQHLSEARRGRVVPKVSRDKTSASLKRHYAKMRGGRKQSPETKAKISAAVKAYRARQVSGV